MDWDSSRLTTDSGISKAYGRLFLGEGTMLLKLYRFTQQIFAWVFASIMLPGILLASEGQFTLLHTNDLHSRFRPDSSSLSFGGLARIKTLVDRIRATTRHVLFVDGGDWSEGSIYYTEGVGAESLRLMDQLGYDVAVVGNHDWLNGPDFLLKAIRDANPSFTLIGANLNSDSYSRSKEFQSKIVPYAIKEVDGVRVAFIGLLTYNFVFDGYFAPIRLSDPFTAAIQLARDLKKSVDVVIGVSHNIVDTNVKILKAVPELDGIIGAHDHRQLNQPIWVTRSGADPAWLVETGYHGRNLGRMDLRVTPDKKVIVENYQLIQVDRSIPEDPGINRQIDQIERLIEKRMGAFFDHDLGKSEVETSRDGIECSSGAFTTHAFRFAVPTADAALDHPNFIYSPLHEGTVRTADAFNMHSAIYNPNTGRTWDIQLLSLRGKTLSWLLNLGGTFPGIIKAGRFLSVSGIQATWNGSAQDFANSVLSSFFPEAEFTSSIRYPISMLSKEILLNPQSSFQNISIGGTPLDPDRVYRIVVSYGVIESIRFINQLIPGLISIEDLKDTGIEAWKAIANYVQEKKVITLDSLDLGSRLRTREFDLGVHYNDIRWKNVEFHGDEATADIEVTIHNTGQSPSRLDSAKISLLKNQYGSDLSQDPKYSTLDSRKLAVLQPGAFQKVIFSGIRLTQDRGVFPLSVQISTSEGVETNLLNNEVTHWFKKGEK